MTVLSQRNSLTAQLQFDTGIFKGINEETLGLSGFHCQIGCLYRQGHAAGPLE